MYAVQLSNVRCVRALIAAGANVNSRDSTRCTPLHLGFDYFFCYDR